MTLPHLPLTLVDGRHTGLLPSTAANYLDAARVCLDRHHKPPTEFTIFDDDQEAQVEVNWLTSDDRDHNAWTNQEDATRDGAYAFALAAVDLRRQVALRRTETRTGALLHCSNRSGT